MKRNKPLRVSRCLHRSHRAKLNRSLERIGRTVDPRTLECGRLIRECNQVPASGLDWMDVECIGCTVYKVSLIKIVNCIYSIYILLFESSGYLKIIINQHSKFVDDLLEKRERRVRRGNLWRLTNLMLAEAESHSFLQQSEMQNGKISDNIPTKW